MREADEIASQVFHPAQQSLRIFRTEGTSLAKRRFLMHRDAAQKDRFAIQRDLRSLHLDRAKANIVGNAVALARNNDVV